MVLFETATLRSGYQLADTKAYGDRIERMLRLSMNIAVDEQVRLQLGAGTVLTITWFLTWCVYGPGGRRTRGGTS